MEVENATCSSQMMAEEERVVVRDISMAAETLTKEGDAFFLLSLRSLCSLIKDPFFLRSSSSSVFSEESQMLLNLIIYICSSKSPFFIWESVSFCLFYCLDAFGVGIWCWCVLGLNGVGSILKDLWDYCGNGKRGENVTVNELIFSQKKWRMRDFWELYWEGENQFRVWKWDLFSCISSCLFQLSIERTSQF